MQMYECLYVRALLAILYVYYIFYYLLVQIFFTLALAITLVSFVRFEIYTQQLRTVVLKLCWCVCCFFSSSLLFSMKSSICDCSVVFIGRGDGGSCGLVLLSICSCI